MRKSYIALTRSLNCRALPIGLVGMLTMGPLTNTYAQRFPTYSPPAQPPFPANPSFTIPTRKGPALPLPGKGSYQTLDSTWHKARISFLAYGIRVDDLDAVIDPEVAAPIVPLHQILRIVVRHDTLGFRAAPEEENIFGKKSDKKEEYHYLKQLFRGGGWTVYPGILKNQQGIYIAVPTRKAEFRQLMLQHFGECAQLRKQIEEGIFDTSATEAIVRQYAHWKSLVASSAK